MKTLTFRLISLIVLTQGAAAPLWADGTSGALTLLEGFGAKPAALGEAYTAAKDDVAVMGYNPAGLGTLTSGQAAFLYQKGIAEDAFGQFMIGAPMRQGSLALSVGFYDGGDITLFDGTDERTVTAQKDIAIGLGGARKFGAVTLGANAKYLRSELVDEFEATAFAADFGLQMPVTSRLNIGAAVQNLGSGITYIEEADELPTIYRMGASYLLVPGAYATTLLVDAPYFKNEKELRPAVGLDVNVGPLAIRAGYKSNSGLQEYSLGAGFLMGRSSIDYAFGMVDELDSQHRVSFAMRFGDAPEEPVFVRRPKEPKASRREVVEAPRQTHQTAAAVSYPAQNVYVPAARHTLGGEQVSKSGTGGNRRVYVIERGDTLAKIAKRFYGHSAHWRKIYTANKHLIDNPTDLETGQKIVLP